MLNIYKSNKIENLVDQFIKVVNSSVPSVFEPEWIGIQSQGIKRWLSIELAKKLGIVANYKFVFPRGIIDIIFSNVIQGKISELMKFQKDSFTWPVMELIPQFFNLPEFEDIKRYLQDDVTDLKLFQLSQKIAHRFDEYSVYRFDMILEWEKEVFKKDLKKEKWQVILWKALFSKYNLVHTAQLADLFFKKEKEMPDLAKNLPKRLSFFAISTLPPLYVYILAKLANYIEINFFLFSPSKEFWAYIKSKKEIIKSLKYNEEDNADFEKELYYEEGNLLLSSFGKIGRDFQLIIEDIVDYVEPNEDLYEDPAKHENYTLLEKLQSDILTLKLRRWNSECKPVQLCANDSSVAIFSCHSAMREVQVLYDQLLELFHNDKTLSPHDIVVVAPNIEKYAPYIQAVFSASQKEQQLIPYNISGHTFKKGTDISDIFLSFLDIAKTRVTIQQVLDLLAIKEVREKFGLLFEDFEKAQNWAKETGIRWGIDKDHRVSEGQPEFNENTWRFGLDRLLLGYAMIGDGTLLFHDILPYDEIEGQDAEILGSFVNFCETLFDFIKLCQKKHTLSQWGQIFLGLIDQMIISTPYNEYQHQSIRNLLDTIVQESCISDFKYEIDFEVIYKVVKERLKNIDKPLTGIMDGKVTFCDMLPMRSIPFKIVCLMGINDGEFPRSRAPAGFDLMAKYPRPGDRSIRNDDRYLFLESLLCAREKFIITYVGQSIKDNSVIPPSVVVSEFIDVICEGFFYDKPDHDDSLEDIYKKMTEKIIIRHPLQPFSLRYFSKEFPSLFTYSQEYFEGAKAINFFDYNIKPFLNQPLPEPQKENLININELIRFFKMPVEYLCTQCLGIYLNDNISAWDNREPFNLGFLESWFIGTSILDQSVMEQEIVDNYNIACAQGRLPLGMAGVCEYESLRQNVYSIYHAVKEQISENFRIEPVNIDLTINNTRIIGRISNLWNGFRLKYTYSKIDPRSTLEAWIYHLLLNCEQKQDVPKQSIIIGRKEGDAQKVAFPYIENSLDILANLIDLYWYGQTKPLLFFPQTSYEYVKVFYQKNDHNEAMKACLKKWQPSKFNQFTEALNLYNQLVFKDIHPLIDSIDNDMSFDNLALKIFEPVILNTQD